MLIRRYTDTNILLKLWSCYQKRGSNNIKSLFSQSSISASASYKLASLSNRSVIQVAGRDSTKLLQGLITNDLNLLKNGKSMYSMLLNTSGRVVYDLIFYRANNDNEFLIECDAAEDKNVIELMKKYKLRSKVTFERRSDLSVSCIFNSSCLTNHHERLKAIPGCFEDTRLTQCGFRILDSSFIPSISSLVEEVALEDYTKHRYTIGISEGAVEVVNSIPLEHNLAWLNGVSFGKGCYIGQELVARTHHVGVIRKRLMPVIFSSDINDNENISGTSVVNEKQKSVGKIIAHCGNVGIGLLRLKEVHAARTLSLNTGNNVTEVSPFKPEWWPLEK